MPTEPQLTLEGFMQLINKALENPFGPESLQLAATYLNNIEKHTQTLLAPLGLSEEEKQKVWNFRQTNLRNLREWVNTAIEAAEGR